MAARVGAAPAAQWRKVVQNSEGSTDGNDAVNNYETTTFNSGCSPAFRVHDCCCKRPVKDRTKGMLVEIVEEAAYVAVG